MILVVRKKRRRKRKRKTYTSHHLMLRLISSSLTDQRIVSSHSLLVACGYYTIYCSVAGGAYMYSTYMYSYVNP